MLDGIKQHFEIYRAALSDAKMLERKRSGFEEKDFLPAALEIVEKPPSPLGRIVVWSIMTFFLIALVWATFGRVDIVATAMGRVIPGERVQTIQSALTGVVLDIHVRDGQRVTEGDILITLDPTISSADLAQRRQELLMARVDAARAVAILDYINTGEAPVFDAPDGLPEKILIAQQNLIAGRVQATDTTMSTFLQQRVVGVQELAIIDRELERFAAVMPFIDEQVEARQELVEKGYSARLVFLQLQERQINQQKQILTGQEQRQASIEAVASIDRQIEEAMAAMRVEVLEELALAEAQIAFAEQELAKAEQVSAMQHLTAPVDGVVEQLSIYTVGAVVEAAQPIMSIVPGREGLIAEVLVLNKDVGFIEVGDEVELKFEAFPFTKYGVIDGIVTSLSLDAIQDENMGLVYLARVSMAEQQIRVQGRDVSLTSGMVVTAEVKTGKRRIIEFLLAPLFRYKDEALRER